MSDTLTPADFQSLDQPLGVDLAIGETQVALELSVESVKRYPPHRYRAEPFSMVLAGPPSPLLPQGVYRMRHPARGMVDLFVVPIGRDAQRSRYEVVFN